MADSKGPTMTANRLAMSKALGAAFLSHQVEQLEQKVVGSGTGRGGGGGNWREGRRGQGYQGRGNGEQQGREWGRRGGGGGGVKGQGRRNGSGSEAEYSTQRRWRDESRGDKEKDEKDADVVVVDVSVLVHGISHLKKWCREGRQEVVIIPLEALNTLDLLKKGTTSLAQRARAASRILEAQVGTNPRIRVQRDDAFVLWDSIPFSTADNNSGAATQPQPPTSPEWVRRTICCARWEIEHATPLTTDTATATDSANKSTPKVVLAVCTSDIDSTISKDNAPAISASPVPLPAPQPNKFEPRSSGTLVLQWATRAGIKVLEVPPTAQGPGSGSQPPVGGAKEGGGRRSGEYGRRSPEDERRGGPGGGLGGRGGGGGGRRGGGGNGPHGHYQQSKPLVERPPAVMAMMEAVSQPSRVVRVLARGEKLDAN